MQAIKEADAVAFRRALPKQLELCGQLLGELSSMPSADLFQQQWVRAAGGSLAMDVLPLVRVGPRVLAPTLLIGRAARRDTR